MEPSQGQEHHQYSGSEIHSYVPDGLIAKIASTPGPLCLRCKRLDIPGFFLDVHPNEFSKLYEKDVLDTIKKILKRRSSCAFCSLVVAALRSRSPEILENLRSPNTSSIVTESDDSPNIYLKPASAGSYQLNGHETQHVFCISLHVRQSTDGDDHEISGGSQGVIRLLANDAHKIDQQPLYHGRIIGNHLSPSLLWSWIRSCKYHHPQCRKIRWLWDFEHLTGPRSLTLIDPISMCLMKARMWKDSDYIALSYVWGGHQGLQLTKANRAQLYKPGALKKVLDAIPAVIRDAINLVRDLDSDYYAGVLEAYGGRADVSHLFLWVDQLCIVQDDTADKAVQIEQMGHIYSQAVATIVATGGVQSNTPLSRTDDEETFQDILTGENTNFVQEARLASPEDNLLSQKMKQYALSNDNFGSAKQIIRNIGGLRLISALPCLAQTLDSSKWTTRAWTLQEAELSHSAIMFSNHQTYFRCYTSVFCEDVVSELNASALKEGISSSQTRTNPLVLQRRERPADDHTWPQTWIMYADIVQDFMARDMTFPSDILHAFKGVAQVLHALTAWDMPNGMAYDVLDYALLWRPNGVIRRRFERNGNPSSAMNGSRENLAIPTYAWAAWKGPISYQPHTFTLRSLISRFETQAGKRTVHVPRFCQDSTLRKTLEPEHPWAPEDGSNWQSFGRDAKWMAPQARSLAFRAHLVNNLSAQGSKDGPAVLRFTTRTLRLVLSTDRFVDSARIDSSSNDDGESGRYVALLNQHHQRVGFVWYVPLLDELRLKGEEVEVVLLSRSKVSLESCDRWTYDSAVGPWREWCLLNVMLFRRLPDDGMGSGMAERITIGKVHEDCAGGAEEEVVRLV